MQIATATENTRIGLNIQLDRAKTLRERNRLGQFATPPKLALDIVDLGKTLLPEERKIHFLDPAFGTGAFYSALLQRFPQEQILSATGYEIDHHYGNGAIQLWCETDLKLEIADFTQIPSPTKAQVNLLLCNPPYARHHHLSREQKQRLQQATIQHTGIKLSGLAGLHCHFLCLTDAWMQEGGLAVWLMPSGFMDVNYGQPIKDYLINRTTLLRIHRFDPTEVQFEDALVSSAVLCFKKAIPPTGHTVCFSEGGSLTFPLRSRQVCLAELRTTPKWTQLGVTSNHSQPPEKKSRQKAAVNAQDTLVDGLIPENLTQPKNCSLKLSDLFTIKRGLATGANHFFILTPEQISQHQLPAAFLQPILPSPRYLQVNEITADAEGNPQIERQLYLLNCTLPEEDLPEQYPHLWHYLQQGKAQGIHTRYLCRHRSPWYTQEKRPPAPLLCTYMGRTSRHRESPFRLLLNHSRATAPNVYLMLYPKPHMASVTQEHPEILKTLWQAFARISPQEFITEGRVYGGGLYKLEPKELGNARLPAFINSLFSWDSVLSH
ncbi:MAG: N-6 DNA methylase [Symploca sp. SIO2E6]|nr:N-6 DNA methylase [Symploca sp. SIO2E6]